MKKRLKYILIFLKVLSFVPFFFGSFVLIFQTVTDFRIISHKNQYKPGLFIVNEKTDEGGGMVGWHVSYDSIALGTVNNIPLRLLLDRVKEYGYNSNIGDTVYVWYRDDKRITLVRKKQDRTLHITRYILRDLRSLMLFGIPPFILITYILRRMKKKSLNQNNSL